MLPMTRRELELVETARQIEWALSIAHGTQDEGWPIVDCVNDLIQTGLRHTSRAIGTPEEQDARLGYDLMLRALASELFDAELVAAIHLYKVRSVAIGAKHVSRSTKSRNGH